MHTTSLQAKARQKDLVIRLVVLAAALLSNCAQQEPTVATEKQQSAQDSSRAAGVNTDQLNDVRILLKGDSLPECKSTSYGRV
jgi:hypothetical protein